MTRQRPRVTTAKFYGDDKFSWAVFVDGQPVVTGLSRGEAKSHSDKIKEQHRAEAK